MEIKTVSKGICAPKGFIAAGIHSGLRKQRKDLALIYSTKPCNAAGVSTKNKVKAAPVIVTNSHLENGQAQAIICNSGNANACTENGMEIATLMSTLTADALNISADDVLVASTGVIGQKLDIIPIESNMKDLVGSLSDNGSSDCVHAIMTTDLAPKEIALTFDIGGKECTVAGIAKGSGMIEPNMATMLGFLTTDISISKDMLKKALVKVVDITFNMVSVDGDTSTNDMALILANGMAENTQITEENDDYNTFCEALEVVCKYLAKAIAADGEGATKLLECTISGADSNEAARGLAKSVINSSLFKAAMFGEDANWGRVLCALGYADYPLDVDKVDVDFRSKKGILKVCKDGKGIAFSEVFAKEVLSEENIIIDIKVGDGQYTATAWGCDLSYDYVKINGDYRS